MAKQVLGLCGSLRKDSWNLKLLRNFLSLLEKEGGFTTKIWPSLEMPLVNEDLENQTLDRRILDFRAAFEAAPVVVLASPEYNASVSPALKNAIDWATRPPANLWAGKVVVLLSASPGALGGARGLIHLRSVVSGIKAWIIPENVQCAHADQAFDAEGLLVNAQTRKQMEVAAESLRNFTSRFLGN
jgi:NAD(P)H-dependent FMN reductase